VTEVARIVRSARAVTIGAEILSGKVHDTNSFELARTLRRLGIELTGIATVPDDLWAIEYAVREARSKAEVVFTSGGIGPTHDDKTIAGVAAALGRKLVPLDSLDPARLFPLANLPSQVHLVPDGSQLIRLGNSSWPTVVVDGIWLLPGIPELFRHKLSWLGDHLAGPAPFVTRSIFLSADEVEIVADLTEVVSRHPEVEIGSYPASSSARFRTQVTFDARSEATLLLAYQDFEARMTLRIVPAPSPDLD
jgi:molybdopterin-biosynthesis enzyme MoeA-like protein